MYSTVHTESPLHQDLTGKNLFAPGKFVGRGMLKQEHFEQLYDWLNKEAMAVEEDLYRGHCTQILSSTAQLFVIVTWSPFSPQAEIPWASMKGGIPYWDINDRIVQVLAPTLTLGRHWVDRTVGISCYCCRPYYNALFHPGYSILRRSGSDNSLRHQWTWRAFLSIRGKYSWRDESFSETSNTRVDAWDWEEVFAQS